ncbi:MAG: phenylacetate-CoA oxygenase subunit PaaJ [Micromonosporaceae bacterium]|nr:phenylacetate-CoA oxygenase subunit PaaJ [Micromonosporaceae bacterium]
MLTIEELGILREVREGPGGVAVTITPTYTGCPAIEAIRTDILAALRDAGYPQATVHIELSPAWSTDQVTESGRAKLAAAGIAPPGRAVPVSLTVRCPRCGSPETEQLSRFGATPCLALWRCRSCAEPFERVKPL